MLTPELNAIVDELFDLEHVVADAAGKKSLSLVVMPDLMASFTGVVAVVGSFADLQAELVAVKSDPATRTALEGYIASKISGSAPKIVAWVEVVVSAVELGFQAAAAAKMA